MWKKVRIPVSFADGSPLFLTTGTEEMMETPAKLTEIQISNVIRANPDPSAVEFSRM
jgi:hypothetical protein